MLDALESRVLQFAAFNAKVEHAEACWEATITRLPSDSRNRLDLLRHLLNQIRILTPTLRLMHQPMSLHFFLVVACDLLE